MDTSDPAVPGAATDADSNADAGAVEFAARLLTALTAMAARSGRHQAEVGTALHCGGLPVDPPRVRAALRLLESEGCISNFVPLSDGGLLLTATGRALGWRDKISPWLTDHNDLTAEETAAEPG
jgi:hypothetical protein